MTTIHAMACGLFYPFRAWKKGSRVYFALLALILSLFTISCANLVKVKDASIPKLIEPLAESDLNGLVAQLDGLVQLQGLRSSRVLIQFIDAESTEKYRTADALLVLQRPDKIRLIVQIPVTGTRIAEMVSESNHFKVAVYYPERYRRFLIGTNDANYSKWREKLGREGRSALISARPFHFTEALMIPPLNLSDSSFTYGLEEALIEEPDTHPGAGKNSRVLRSFYVVSELGLSTTSGAASRVRRRFWFDRTNKLRFTRQQIFDNQGTLTTEVHYSNYQKLSDESPYLWPSVVVVARPHDSYSARLTFSTGRFEVDPTDLSPNAFTLENQEGLLVTDLDAPNSP